MPSTFDECFSTFPEVKRPPDLGTVWNQAEAPLATQPLAGQSKLNLKKSLGWESLSEVSFSAGGSQRLQGTLSVPRRRGLPPVILSFHDYHDTPQLNREATDLGMAHFSLQLRHHHNTPQEAENVLSIPLFQRYGLHDLEASYPYQCFLDALRAVDFLETQKNIDATRIAIVGRGLGAAMAVFALWRRPQVQAIALEQMGFVAFPLWLKEATVDYSNEIRFLLAKNARQKTKARKNLDYLDVLNLAQDISKPVLAVINMNDALNPARPAFGFFNRLQCDKTMELFTDENQAVSQKEMRKKSLTFLAEILKEPAL